MSFIRTYGGNRETMAHSGMAAVQRAIDAGLTINQIQSQAAREGISFGSKAQDYINARKGSFIAKYGGNEGTMAHAGLQAVYAASAAGLSYDEMRKQAAAEGVQFQSGAQQVFRQYDAQQAEIQRQQEAEQRQIATQLEAEQRQKDRLKQMEIGQRTQAANVARAGLESKFQISSSSKLPKTSGTQGFKRRQLQVNPTAYKALASGSSKQASSSGVLNP